MSVSLTKEQLLERLLEPQRIKLLRTAIDKDAHDVFPIRFQVQSQNHAEINLDITEALRKLIDKWLFRAIDIAYNETLDDI